MVLFQCVRTQGPATIRGKSINRLPQLALSFVSRAGINKTLSAVAVAVSLAFPAITVANSSAADTAWVAWQGGDMVKAAALANELSGGPERDHLLFLCSLVNGQYAAALAHYRNIPSSYERYSELNGPVIDCYLHLGRNEEALAFARQRKTGPIEALRMRAARPMQASLETVTVIPFAKHALTDYFPAFRVELEGKPMTIHMDTGTSYIAMHPDDAKQLGIPLVRYGTGNHGHRKVPLSFGIARKFKLGEAVLENVPVIAFPTVTEINFGTNILQQFLSTIDYPRKRLILSPRRNQPLRDEHMKQLPLTRIETPFYMWGDHYMFARGSVADSPATFFMDSGLVALRKINDDPTVQAGFTSSRERYLRWGYNNVQMDQGIFQSHLPLNLGPLRQYGLWCLAGPTGEHHGKNTFGGVQMDGDLAHAFVKQYAWTLDFENHKYTFSMAEEAPAPIVQQESTSSDTDRAAEGWEFWRKAQIWKAESFANDRLTRAPSDSHARHLLVMTHFVNGRYEQGLAHFALIDPDYERINALSGPVINAYQQIGRHDRAVSFARAAGFPQWRVDWLAKRRDYPLKVRLTKTTVVPFSQNHPLPEMMPAVSIVINGRECLGHLDTGGSFVSMSPKKATELGLQTSPYGRGFANGRPTGVEIGLVDKLTIGDATLQNVPVRAVSSLTGGFGSGRIEDLVILGTNVLGQFLATWDNEKQRLILSPRQNPASRREHFASYVSPTAQPMPFYMVPDHYLFAHGSIDGRDAAYFVDTGMVTWDSDRVQPCLSLPARNCDRYGVSGEFKTKTFVDGPGDICLGAAKLSGQRMVVMPNRSFNFAGIELDAMLGHGFLKQFVWTIDFDTRTWYLRPFPTAAK